MAWFDFSQGSLKVESYVRPGKLSTANDKLFHRDVEIIAQDKFSFQLQLQLQRHLLITYSLELLNKCPTKFALKY